MFNFKIDAVINLDIPEDVLVKRLSEEELVQIVVNLIISFITHLKKKVYVTYVVEN